LAAATRLNARGVEVTVLEARERIGGRIWTIHHPELSVPVELGAEFLHGEAIETRRIAERALLSVQGVPGRRWLSREGKLRPHDAYEEQLARVFERLDDRREPDRPVAAAMRAMRSLSSNDRRLARKFIEGFHAAEPDLVSERSLAGSATEDSLRLARVGRGYHSVVDALADPIRDRIRLRSPVRRIIWKRGRVTVETERPGGRLSRLSAKQAIVAVPLGVLQSRGGRGIDFDPVVSGIDRAAARLVMGGVLRVALHFDEPFWTTPRFAGRHGQARVRDLTVVQSLDDIPFPVWWTAYPAEAPLLVGWSGGPQTRSLASEPPVSIGEAATRSLARVFGVSRAAVKRHLRASFTHNWLQDPWARGAYSYIAVGGSSAPATLARPVDRTIFIAGEHSITGRNGTVDGAIASGYRAARQILET
jgi:monoamine oxidase